MNKKHLSHTLLSGICICALAGCQTTTAPSAPDRFAEADASHNGKLTRDEADDYLVKQLFDARDTKHDGKLTWEEWHVPGDQSNKAKFDKVAGSKGYVTLDEAIAYERKHHVLTKDFKKADTNHDGALTREEVSAYYGSKEGSPWNN